MNTAMSGEMPKRNRTGTPNDTPVRPAEVIEVNDTPLTTQPSEVVEIEEARETTSPLVDRDPILEQQLDALEVDEDFRESIRAMTPNTRRDVLNDIIRQQQQEQLGIGENFHFFGMPENPIGGHIFRFTASSPGEAAEAHPDNRLHSEGHDSVDEEGGVVDDEEDDTEEDGGHHIGNQPPRRDRTPFMMGHPHLRVFTERDGGPMNAIDFLQLLMQSVSEPAQQRTIFEERLQHLQNILGMLQQTSAMQSMGLDRDIDEMSYEELLELEERIGSVSKGVPPALLESCMTRMEVTTSEDTCPICQEALNASADKVCVKLLNCPHMFHKPCVKQWLTDNKTCPICKEEVLPRA